MSVIFREEKVDEKQFTNIVGNSSSSSSVNPEVNVSDKFTYL